jgi:UDP-3-O-[3-hydroxymyristoyl] glucosamine N-acyltransferase
MSKLGKTLAEVCDLIGEGEIVGDPDFECRAVASLDRAQRDELSFVRDRKYFEAALQSAAGAVIVPEPLSGWTRHQIVVEAPFVAFGLILRHIAIEKRAQPAGVHPTASIADDVQLGNAVTVGAGACICEAARIGDRAVIYANAFVGARSVVGAGTVLCPNVVIMEDVTVGERVLIHGGTVIGGDGYGFLQMEGKHVKIPQVGAIEIGDDVEIGALVTIDRATVDTTVIGRGTKIGDLVHVAHNCIVGEDVLLLPTVAVSGSARIGDRAILAGRAGVSDGVTVGEDAILGGCCVTYKDVEAGANMWGNPARDRVQQMRIEAALSSLPEMKKELRELRRRLDGA